MTLVKGTKLISEGALTDPVNLGSSELVTIDELVDLVERIAGVTLGRSHNLNAPQGVRGRNSDNTLMHTQFGWELSTTLLDGLERTYRWIYDEMASKA